MLRKNNISSKFILFVSIIRTLANTPEAIGKKGEQKIENDLNNINF